MDGLKHSEAGPVYVKAPFAMCSADGCDTGLDNTTTFLRPLPSARPIAALRPVSQFSAQRSPEYFLIGVTFHTNENNSSLAPAKFDKAKVS